MPASKSLVAQSLPDVWETWVQSPGQDDPLEKGMAIHSSILPWEIPRTEELGRLSPWAHKESDRIEQVYYS